MVTIPDSRSTSVRFMSAIRWAYRPVIRLYRTVAEESTYAVEADAFLPQPGRERVPQVFPAERVLDVGGPLRDLPVALPRPHAPGLRRDGLAVDAGTEERGAEHGPHEGVAVVGPGVRRVREDPA